MPYWRLFYHVVWATRNRQAWLQPRHEPLIEETIKTVCRDRGVLVHAVGFVPDHIHVAASIPPAHAIGEVVGHWKGATSHRLRREGGLGDDVFSWQREYGVHSFGERALADVLAYVKNQPERHRLGRVWSELERIDESGTERTRSDVSGRPPASNAPSRNDDPPSRALQRPSDGESGH